MFLTFIFVNIFVKNNWVSIELLKKCLIRSEKWRQETGPAMGRSRNT